MELHRNDRETRGKRRRRLSAFREAGQLILTWTRRHFLARQMPRSHPTPSLPIYQEICGENEFVEVKKRERKREIYSMRRWVANEGRRVALLTELRVPESCGGDFEEKAGLLLCSLKAFLSLLRRDGIEKEERQRKKRLCHLHIADFPSSSGALHSSLSEGWKEEARVLRIVKRRARPPAVDRSFLDSKTLLFKSRLARGEIQQPAPSGVGVLQKRKRRGGGEIFFFFLSSSAFLTTFRREILLDLDDRSFDF